MKISNPPRSGPGSLVTSVQGSDSIRMRIPSWMMVLCLSHLTLSRAPLHYCRDWVCPSFTPALDNSTVRVSPTGLKASPERTTKVSLRGGFLGKLKDDQLLWRRWCSAASLLRIGRRTMGPTTTHWPRAPGLITPIAWRYIRYTRIGLKHSPRACKSWSLESSTYYD